VRIYHRDKHTPFPTFRRTYGPLKRFDHHRPVWPPAEDPDGRSVIYAASELQTAGAEVFGEFGNARVCPSYRVARIVPGAIAELLDLTGAGAMWAGTRPSLGSGDIPYDLSQAWARAIYEDRPASPEVCGIHYTGSHEEGECLCLWDTGPSIYVERNAAGVAFDDALLDSRVFSIFLTAMTKLPITVERVAFDECISCLDNAGF
jgi:hypothetical protein